MLAPSFPNHVLLIIPYLGTFITVLTFLLQEEECFLNIRTKMSVGSLSVVPKSKFVYALIIKVLLPSLFFKAFLCVALQNFFLSRDVIHVYQTQYFVMNLMF